MTTAQLRVKVKKAVDKLDQRRLTSIYDYMGFLSRPTIAEQVRQGRKEIAEGKGVGWRKVRSDV